MIEILIFGVSSNQGGIETYYRKLWNNINKDEFHFNFIDMTGEGNRPCFYEEYIETGVNFYKITPRNVSIRKNREDIRNVFSAKSFDVLHFSVNTLSYIFPIEEAVKNNVKVIVHSRNAGTNHGVITKIFHIINKRRIQKYDLSRIAVSELAGQWLFGTSSFDVINNGVDTNIFRYDEAVRMEYRKKLGIDNQIVIGNVGAFLPAKNHSFIITIFKELLRHNINAVLLLIGDGPLKPEIEKQIHEADLSEKVLMLGNQKDVVGLYDAMDIFLFPSIYEGFPNSVLEAESMGLPCVISANITPEVSVINSCISLSLQEAPSVWGQRLIDLLRKPEGKRENAHNEINNMGFSVKDEIGKIEGLYRSVVINGK